MLTPITPDDIVQLRQALEEERERVAEAVRERMHQAEDPLERALANNLGAVDDRASGNTLNDEELSEVAFELGELRAIAAALERIADGSYGTCANCGEPIAAERMHAQPTARLCLACQSAAERHPGVYGPRTGLF